MLQSSGTIDKTQSNIKDVFAEYDVHLVVQEEATTKGIHYHYLVVHEGTRDTLRHSLKRKLDTKVTCVDPSRGNNTWQKAKQYVCKLFPVNVVTRSGLEFTDENLKAYHQASNDHNESLKKKRQSLTRMQMIREETKGIQTLPEIAAKIIFLYDREGWLAQKHTMIAQTRTIYMQTEEGKRDTLGEILSGFNYTEINR